MEASEIISFRGEWAFLSNFYPSKVVFEGTIYPTVEHAYQAAKTDIVDARDPVRNVYNKFGEFVRPTTPGEAKRAGRKVPLRPDWDHVKLAIMHELLRQKFSTQPLKHQLMVTHDAVLVEGNTWGGTYWGMVGGTGMNWLGRLLMLVRSGLWTGEEDS